METRPPPRNPCQVCHVLFTTLLKTYINNGSQSLDGISRVFLNGCHLATPKPNTTESHTLTGQSSHNKEALGGDIAVALKYLGGNGDPT